MTTYRSCHRLSDMITVKSNIRNTPNQQNSDSSQKFLGLA